MKPSIVLAGWLCLAAPSAAAEEAGIAAVSELGRLNGQALACGQKDTAAWLRVLVLSHVPKTPRFGEAYEQATNAAFLAQSRDGATCPDAREFTSRLDGISARLRAEFPGQPAAEAR
ncbi:MAG: hypothetical protein HY778_14660 [Betaproteobacteria bacterium]|nr:hypothetical protein [Betaproteobacteria bacterium]